MKIILTLMMFLMAWTVDAYEFPETEGKWLRAAPPNVKMMAAYLDIENNDDTEKTLVGAFSPAFGMVEIHRSIEENGVYRMEEQKQLTLKSGDKLQFKPGGLHIMLMMPKETIKLGEDVRICLIYQDSAGEKHVQHLDFPVKDAADN